MNAATSMILSNLRSRAPVGALRSNPGTGAPAPGAGSAPLPALWYESGVVWGIPDSGPKYPVAFSTSSDFFNTLQSGILGTASPTSGAVNAAQYPAPYTPADAPAWGFDFWGLQLFVVLACSPSAMPFATKFLSSFNAAFTSPGPIYPGLGSTCVAGSSSGTTTVNIQYVLVTGNPLNPSEFPFTVNSLYG